MKILRVKIELERGLEFGLGDRSELQQYDTILATVDCVSYDGWKYHSSVSKKSLPDDSQSVLERMLAQATMQLRVEISRIAQQEKEQQDASSQSPL